MSIMKYLNNKKGETIAETLVATLIAALSMVMFAGMVMASKTVVDASNKKVVKYYDGFSQLVSKQNLTKTPMGPITLYTNSNGVMYYDYAKITNTEGSGGEGGSGEEGGSGGTD